jgi:hypothetical protein
VSAPASKRPGDLVRNEPVAVAAVARAAFYALLGQRGLDPSLLAALVTLVEALTAFVTRKFVSPTYRRAAPENAEAAGVPAVGDLDEALSTTPGAA